MGFISQVKWKVNLEPGICRMVAKVQVEQRTVMGRVNSRKVCSHSLKAVLGRDGERVETDCSRSRPNFHPAAVKPT